MSVYLLGFCLTPWKKHPSPPRKIAGLWPSPWDTRYNSKENHHTNPGTLPGR